jgi:hypothetical protein
MIFSRPLLGTDTSKVKLSWFEYIWISCLKQGWMNCWYSFENWKDLVFNNYQNYALLATDDPLEQCILYFWDSLEDDIYPKEFLESLLQMCDDVKTGKEKLIPIDDDFFDRIEKLIDETDVDLNEELENE